MKMILLPIKHLSRLFLVLSYILYHFDCEVASFSPISSSSSSSSSKKNSSSFHIQQVTKVSPKEFDIHQHYFHEQQQKILREGGDGQGENQSSSQRRQFFETPVLIENVLSPLQCEQVCDSIVCNLGEVSVDLQRKRTSTRKSPRKSPRKSKHDVQEENERIKEETKIYHDYSLNEALSLMMESKRGDSLFCFCEGLLDSDIIGGDGDDNDESAKSEMDQVKQLLTTSRESIFRDTTTLEDGDDDDDDDDDDDMDHNNNQSNTDLFNFFPGNIKPSDCLILAGEGATSTLHRDPFCWTGTSLCLEGCKVWRFIAPPGAMQCMMQNNHDQNQCTIIDSNVTCVDELLESYRLPSVAWDERKSDSEDIIYLSSGWQSDYSLYSSFNDDDDDDDDDDEKNRYPSAEQLASMDEDEKIALIENLSQDLDLFSPNCPQSYKTDSKHCDDESSKVSVWTVVQKPGDLLIIPAHWWHQTYAFEPSLAIASQRCGKERDSIRVFGHILDTLNGQQKKNILNDINIKMFIDDEYIAGQSEENLVKNFFNVIKG